MDNQLILWGGFTLFIFVMLALDLGVFHRKSHEVKMREALIWSTVWITLAFTFSYGVYEYKGKEKWLEFITAYLIEYSLSVDNIFVFVIIFSYFNVAPAYQHKVLFWGILGALVMRIIFIFAGVALISKFHWLIYVFGAFLIFTGIRMGVQGEQKLEPDKNPVVRLFKKLFPVADKFHGDKFVIRENGKRIFTPLFIVLLVVELTDVIFAVDSIPAVLAISKDTFIVYTSNVFAILGLRSLYFALKGMADKFHYLKYALAIILIFVGVKMCISDIYKIPINISLATIGGILGTAIITSLLVKRDEDNTDLPPNT